MLRRQVSFLVAGTFITASCALIGVGVLRYMRKKRRCQRKITVIQSLEDWQRVEAEFLDECYRLPLSVLGFDCEWVSRGGENSRVSLIQLATAHSHCLLIRLNLLPHVPASLRQILKDRRVVKTGVGCLHDAQKLNHEYGLIVCGCVDLRHLAVRSRHWRRKLNGKLNLQNVCQVVLGVELDKSIYLRCSDWAALQLTPQQVEYAAMDATAGVEIFKELLSDKLKRHNNSSDIVHSLCQGIVDVNFDANKFLSWFKKLEEPVAPALDPRNLATDSELADPTFIQHMKINDGEERPRASKLKKRKTFEQLKPVKEGNIVKLVRKRPLYENCRMLAPDGTLLATCDMEKVKWYVSRGLAEEVGPRELGQPATIQLVFEPAGRPVGTDGDYYTQGKENRCVVCGSYDACLRKAVIPAQYRKYFPPFLKDHLSHDILCMCIHCHRLSCYYDHQLSEQLALECQAPINTHTNTKMLEDQEKKKVKSAARALVKDGERIPETRRKELRQVVCGYYKQSEVDDYLLAYAADMDVRVFNEDYVPHAQKVVQHMIDNKLILEFERRWRQHLLDVMSPEHMPALWRVEHNFDKLRPVLEEEGDELVGVHYHGKKRCRGGQLCVDRRYRLTKVCKPTRDTQEHITVQT